MEKRLENQKADGKRGLSLIWQIVVGIVVFLLAAVISLFEVISQSRKYKKASIPIEISTK